MDHESAKASFSGCYDEILSEEDRIALEDHLAECPECKKEWESFKLTLNSLSQLQMANPNEGFAEKVTLEIKRRGLFKLWNKPHFMVLKTAFLSFILILFLILVYLTYVFLFSEPKQPTGASHKDRDGLHIIGPVDTKISTPTDVK
jgi:predicted anti-sigma-YlaC factor YlaD